MNIEHRLPHDPQDIAPERITELLTISAERLDANTVEALCRARHKALDRQAVQASALALDGRHWLHWPAPHSPRQWAAAVLLLAVIAVSTVYWQHQHRHEMMAHLDVAILTDDMPLEVFVDQRTE